MGELTRRQFIGGAVGLTSLAIVGPSLIALGAAEVQPVFSGIQNQLIENQIFHLRGPLTLKNMRDVTFGNCRFVFENLGPFEHFVNFEGDCLRVAITNCRFNVSNTKSKMTWIDLQ
jgi:hypothetical protein